MKDIYIKATLRLIESDNDIDAVLSKLKEVLTKRGHQNLLPAILSGLLKFLTVNEQKNTPKVILAKPGSVDEDKIKSVLALFGAKNIKYNTEYNPNLIGGLVVKDNKRMLDVSYQTKLLELYQSITK